MKHHAMVRKQLRFCEDKESLTAGKYVLYQRHHFVGMEIWSDGTYIVRPTCRTHVGNIKSWNPEDLDGFVIFEMCPLAWEKGSRQDVRGGGSKCAEADRPDVVRFCNPLAGHTMVECDSAMLCGQSFLRMARTMCSVSLNHYPFAMAFLVEGQPIQDEEASWLDLGCPSNMALVLLPITTKLSRQLLAAVRQDSGLDVHRCLAKGQNPNFQYREDRTALCYASSLGSVAAMSVLLDAGADPNMADVHGVPPLQHAAMEGHTGVVRTLLAHGARPDHQNKAEGMTAAHYAVRCGPCAIDLLQVLRQAGADLLLADSTGWTTFTCAADGPCFRFVADAVWGRLTWPDLFMRQLDAIFSYVPVWSAAATCRGMGLHAKYLRDWQGGADSDSSLSLGPTFKKILHVGHTDPVL